VRSSRRRWRWAQCRPRSAAPTFGHAGTSTPAWCPIYRLHECPQPGVVLSWLVLLPVVAARDQKWRVASDKSGLLSLLSQFGLWLRSSWQNGTNGFPRSVVGSSCGTLLIVVRQPSGQSMSPSHITVRRRQGHCKAVSSYTLCSKITWLRLRW